MGILHGQGAKLMGEFTADRGLSFDALSDADLLSRLRAVLNEGLYGMCFSAYVERQGPGSVLSAEQVRRRLAQIAPHTGWIRTFSCTEGHGHAPRIAHELGLKTLVGAWVGDDHDKNRVEVDAAIEIARQGHADLVAVGNEVLLRGELSVDEIIALIRRVQDAVPGVPVGYVDAYFLFPQQPELVEACDFLPVNCYPFWEEVSLERAVPYAREMIRRVRAVAGDKPVLIAETGWPSSGSPVGQAVPSPRNMALYALNVHAWADREDLPLFWFSAYDEAWKVDAEGDRGATWGFWDAHGELKLVG